MLIDQTEVYVRGGKGGNGCVSFRREIFVPKGGPDGGDGGNGGSVQAEANVNVETLLDFNGRHHWIAENGRPGLGKNMTGRRGQDILLSLPAGTLIFDRETGVLLKDLTTPGEKVCLAQGGKGGKGNARFARSTHQTPREFEVGGAGQERWLRLELKLIADVGIIGLPNAGKSTLLSRLSHARPKIADYPFTTLRPQLGIAELSDHRRMVLADIPGLIEGAHEGAGLGDAFLRHIERTRVLLHLVDVGSDWAMQKPVEAYRTVRSELAKYSSTLDEKLEIVAANKMDLTGSAEAAAALSAEIGREVLPVSGVTGAGLSALLERLWQCVRQAKEAAAADAAKSLDMTRECA
ncbi:MAG: GTPase ObgE [Planctomycetota bacterium]